MTGTRGFSEASGSGVTAAGQFGSSRSSRRTAARPRLGGGVPSGLTRRIRAICQTCGSVRPSSAHRGGCDVPLLPCAPHAPTGAAVRDLPRSVSGRAAGSREGDAGPGDVAPARVGQAGGSGDWAAFWARLRAAAALRASRAAFAAWAAFRACAERSSGVWLARRAAVAFAAF